MQKNGEDIEENQGLIDKKDDQQKQKDVTDPNETCCGCFGLKTGAKILGVFSIIGLIMLLLVPFGLFFLGIQVGLAVAMLACLIPNFVGTFLYTKWLWCKDSEETRAKLPLAQMLIAISQVLVIILRGVSMAIQM